MGKISLKTALIGGLIALIVVAATLSRACRLTTKIGHLEGQIQEISAISEADRKAAEKIKAEQTKIIGDMTKKIAVHESEVSKKNEQIKDVNKKLTTLEGEYATLTDCPSQRENLTKQVAEWKNKFSLSETIIWNKDGIIFSLVGKYEAQVKITAAVQIQLDNCTKMQSLLEREVTALKWELRKSRLVGSVKTGLVLGAAGFIIYNLFKGK